MSRIKWLLVLGGVLITLAGVGLAMTGDATVRSFAVLTMKITDAPSSPPESLGQLAVVAGLAGLLAVGWTAACAGMSAPAPDRCVTVLGRLAYLAAGLATIVSTVPLGFGTILLRHQFLVIATSSSAAPRPDQLELILADTCRFVPVGFYLAMVGGVFAFVTGCFGFRRTNSSPGAVRPQLKSYLVTGATAAFATLFCGFFLLVSWHGGALREILSNPESSPKPTELAGHLMGILSKSLAAYACLALLGAAQVLAAALAPGRRNDG
jgi:hypothetical protein